MLARLYGCAVLGVEGTLVEVEVKVGDGLEAFTIVGLPYTQVEGVQERARAAIINSGYLFPHKQVTVNLASATFLKEGFVCCDLAIAVGILLASGQIVPGEWLDDTLFLGVLSPDGNVCSTNGILAMVELAREKHFRSVFMPAVNVVEATLIEEVTIYPVERLEQLVAHLNNERQMKSYQCDPHLLANIKAQVYVHDMAMVRGQEHVKRALEVAASGGHHIVLSGAPGSGKALLARTFPSILPPMTIAEILNISKIYSIYGMLAHDLPLISQRPFRAPHCTIRKTALLGGGQPPRPGEVSLAHRGVLFLDELSSFDGNVLEALRQSLEEKMVTVEGAQGMVSYPAHALLIATMRPCPCGFLNDPTTACGCSATAITHYQKRTRGSLLGCFDICIEVPRIAHEKLADKRQVETSAIIRVRVQEARERQRLRFEGTRLTCNAEIGFNEVGNFCQVDALGEKLLAAATQQLRLSARACHRVLRLARTLADLAGRDRISAMHVAEAIQYRSRITESIT
ncbi:MAG: YifB family Mg chelatase-like AAA ATPase [Ktedonobacteraceae bacterium]